MIDYRIEDAYTLETDKNALVRVVASVITYWYNMGWIGDVEEERAVDSLASGGNPTEILMEVSKHVEKTLEE